MATGISQAHHLRDDVDWSKSHRDPPPLPTNNRSPTQESFVEPFPDIGVARSDHFGAVGGATSPPPRALRSPNQDLHPSRVNATGGSVRAGAHWPIASGGDNNNNNVNVNSGSAAAPTSSAGRSRSQSQETSRPRRGSLNFLRRTPTNSSKTSGARRASEEQQAKSFYTEPSSPPPIPQPKTLFAQAQQEAALRKSPSTGSNMLRKVSRSAARKEAAAEEDRKRKEAASRPPPHLPSLPSLTPFSEDQRPDSVAIFNQAYTTSNSPPTIHSRPTNNFSRPNNMAPSSSITSSSSPAYTSRGGGVVGSSSPPDVQAKLVNGAPSSGEYVAIDPYNRTDSIANRARFSYASSATNVNSYNSPRRIRRKKDPTPFNILVIGAKNSGKTSFISFLKHSLSLPANKQSHGRESEPQVGGNRSSFTSTYLETDIDGERVGLTLWDSAGLEKNVVDLQLREAMAFIEAKFEDTFAEEQKVMRTPGVKDTHIHCVFLILDPVRLDSSTVASPKNPPRKGQSAASLDDALDLQVMRALWGKTTVIPIISKADTLTIGHMAYLKRTVWESIKSAKLDPLEALELEDDAEEDDDDPDANGVGSADESDSSLPVPKTRKSHNRQSSLSVLESLAADDLPYLPMSIISPDPYDLPPFVSKSKVGDKIGRRFPWGFADPYSAEHCDFGRLRDSIFSEWRVELRELSRSRWYEQWRTSRLNNLPGQRQRVRGGVTPTAAVPRDGRIASQNSRHFSPPTNGGASNVPRNASNLSSIPSTNGNGLGMAVSAAGTGSRGPSGASDVGSVRNGTIRSNESTSQL